MRGGWCGVHLVFFRLAKQQEAAAQHTYLWWIWTSWSVFWERRQDSGEVNGTTAREKPEGVGARSGVCRQDPGHCWLTTLHLSERAAPSSCSRARLTFLGANLYSSFTMCKQNVGGLLLWPLNPQKKPLGLNTLVNIILQRLSDRSGLTARLALAPRGSDSGLVLRLLPLPKKREPWD